MRFRKSSDLFSVRAISGTYVVLLAMDMKPSNLTGFLGWAIKRRGPGETESHYLQGMRTFESTRPDIQNGELVSTEHHPIQDFVWSDFTAHPGQPYTYTVIPVFGSPDRLTYGKEISLDIRTEEPKAKDEPHEVYFNRGVIGSQAYARRFKNADPAKLTGKKREEAFEWLSRGLFEAARDFLRRVRQGDSVRAAVYEFSLEDIVREFGLAQERCGDVKLVYDARIKIKKDGTEDESMVRRVKAVKSLLRKHDLASKGISIPRKAGRSYISHNKFIVLIRNGVPNSVWTGSTNFTESGFYGQSNVGHVVNDPQVAKEYLDYWHRLAGDPENKALNKLNEAKNPGLSEFPPPPGTTTIFSPRADQAMLNWYAGLMDRAKTLMCFTAAFGVNKVFLDVLNDKPSPSNSDLRYLFLEKWGVSKEKALETQAELQKNRHNLAAVGSYLKKDVLHEYLADRWKQERFNSLSKNVKFTHGKYMLVDPLSDDPIVVCGSANFSKASTVNNDENMLIIRGDKRVADIYLGEFMRLWQHYRLRSIVNKLADESGGESNYAPNYLVEDDSWTEEYYDNKSLKFKRREAFNR